MRHVELQAARRKERLVVGIDGDRHRRAAEPLGEVQERFGAGVEHRADAPLDPPEAHLPVHAQVRPAFQSGCVLLHTVDRNPVALEIERRLAEGGARIGAQERRMALVERLVELGLDALLAADLRAQQPFAPEPVHPGAAEQRAEVVRRLAAEIRSEVQAEPQVVRAPGLLDRRNPEDRAVALAHHVVVERLQVAVVELAHQVARQGARVQRLALLLRDAAPDRLGTHEAGCLDAHLVHDRRCMRLGKAHAFLPCGVGLRRDGEPPQLVCGKLRRLAPARRGVDLARERGRGDVAQVGADVHVARPQLAH